MHFQSLLVRFVFGSKHYRSTIMVLTNPIIVFLRIDQSNHNVFVESPHLQHFVVYYTPFVSLCPLDTDLKTFLSTAKFSVVVHFFILFGFFGAYYDDRSGCCCHTDINLYHDLSLTVML